jgi:hypothetical protein
MQPGIGHRMQLEQPTSVKSTPQTTEGASTGPIVERRRPGRRATVSPALLHLLRNPAGQDGPPLAQPTESGDLDPVRGIGAAMILSSGLWAVVVALLRHVRH